MLNTPKYTWGVQDIAKGRAMLHLVRSLEDNDFKVSLQARAGLDYFAPDIEKAKVQLAAVTALMDDIEPDNPNSPEIIHVVSYSEALRLATPDVIIESIKITRGALHEYRKLKKEGKTYDTKEDSEIVQRYSYLYSQAKESVKILESRIPNLYTAEGLFKAFKEGFLPVPYILDEKNEYPEAKGYETSVIKGGVYVVNEDGDIVDSPSRYKSINMT